MFGQVVVCGQECFRGELIEKDLKGNLGGRQDDKDKSLLNN